MIGFRLAVGIAIVLGFTGCGSDQDTAADTVMPDVMGLQLDVALSDIERAGFDDEVEVLSDGAFGVVNESNWQVCDQLPAAGEAVASAPRLTVDRSCEGDAPETTIPEPTTPPTTAEPTATDPPSEATTQEPETSEPGEPEAEQILTVENSEDLAALLDGPACDEDAFLAFAGGYQGRTIEFDGHISDLQNHGDSDTRYDILLDTGDFSETTLAGIQNGPSFKFEDVNFSELNFTGPEVPDSITMGDNVTVTATVDQWNADNCLFFLDPVATEVR